MKEQMNDDLLACNSGDSDPPLPTRVLVLRYELDGAAPALRDGCVLIYHLQDNTIHYN